MIERILAHRRERGDEEAPTASLYTRTVTDPATFTAPVEVRWIYDWHPELTIEPYECTLGE